MSLFMCSHKACTAAAAQKTAARFEALSYPAGEADKAVERQIFVKVCQSQQ